jgi:peptide-methionine (S)-S-oxide reductase
VRTTVGYAGGKYEGRDGKGPTYHDLGDHTEALEVEFDPTVVSFEKLLEVFWSEHESTAPAYSTQYKAILFFQGAEQERVARSSAKKVAEAKGKPVLTEIRPAGRFWPAEAYHQKYYLRGSDLMPLFVKAFPADAALVASTAAARANGFEGGYVSLEDLRAELAKAGIEVPAEIEPPAGGSCPAPR